jgi:hypothetical protein
VHEVVIANLDHHKVQQAWRDMKEAAANTPGAKWDQAKADQATWAG